MHYLIGVDIGTSGTKAVLFDQNGAIVASALHEYPLYQPRNGWAEQEPLDWWQASYSSIHEVMAKSGVSPSSVKGIGLSGQMHGLVMLDKEDKVIRPAIIWCDQRTEAECVQITELVGREKLMEITANPAITGFTASKIMWVKNHEPHNFERCVKIMLPKDYIRYRLTGEFATEVSDASGMQLMDIKNRRWSDFVCSRLGIDLSKLGKVYESCEATGTLTREAAQLCGLEEGIIVAGGAGDQAASAVGNGIVREGIVSATIGTSGVVFAHMDNMTVDPLGRVHTFCHAVPGAWHIMGVTQGAGLSFKWLRDNFFASEKEAAQLLGDDPNALLDRIAARVPAGANNLLFLPYLMGERTPHLDSDCRGCFFGISAIHTRADFLRAVLEGVIYSLNDCMSIIKSMGVTPDFVYASGGGAKSELWRQMMADTFAMKVAVNSTTEGGALGVAILAGVAAGIYKSVPDACSALVSENRSQTPNPAVTDKYAAMYKLYAGLYPVLKGAYKALANI